MTTTTNTARDEGKGKGRCPRWLKLALIASVAINIMVLGVFVGAKMKDHKRGDNRQIAWIVRLVPDDRKAFAQAHFDARREQMRAAQRDRIALMRRITDAIRTEPFLPEELNAALRARRDASAMRREIVHDGLVSMLAQFNAAERAVFTERLEEQLERAQRRWQDRQ